MTWLVAAMAVQAGVSVEAGTVKVEKGSAWRHEDATRIYSDAERDQIGGFLRWVAER